MEETIMLDAALLGEIEAEPKTISMKEKARLARASLKANIEGAKIEAERIAEELRNAPVVTTESFFSDPQPSGEEAPMLEVLSEETLPLLTECDIIE